LSRVFGEKFQLFSLFCEITGFIPHYIHFINNLKTYIFKKAIRQESFSTFCGFTKGFFSTFRVATSLSTPFSKPSNYVLRLNAPCFSLETANVSFCIATTKEDKPGPANPAKTLA
jgi:hypothetical protein